MSCHKRARLSKSRFFLEDRAGFVVQLKREIRGLVRKAWRKGLVPAVRLNGSSDIAWERVAPELFTEFPGVRFYDYTKSYSRMLAFLGQVDFPSNYHLTFSRDERPENQEACLEILALGGSVAIVFDKAPETWHGYQVVDGDETDVRFEDPSSCVVALSTKGAGRKDRSGFVVLAN